jgi:DNA-binding NarL/FixJ family response regulator
VAEEAVAGGVQERVAEGVLVVARAAARDGLPTRAILLFGELEGDAAFRALASGAAARLTPGVGPDALRRAIAAAARGDPVLAPELQSGVAREIRLRDGRPLLTRLSERCSA